MILSVSSPSIEEPRKVYPDRLRECLGNSTARRAWVEENEAVVSSKTSVSTPSSRPGRVLGVSIIGEQAEELIHIG